jgi:hypothetical protein
MTTSEFVDLIWAEGADKNLPSQPMLHQHGLEVQPFGSLRLLPIALAYATFGVSEGVQTAEFDREAIEFAEAVASAIRAVESAVPGARVVEVHREHDIAAAG